MPSSSSDLVVTIMRRVTVAWVAIIGVWLPDMAVASGVGASEEVFSDGGGVHGYGIEQMARLGIDTGCGDGLFCSSDPISRAEMAAWLYRAAAHLNTDPTPSSEMTVEPVLSDVADGAWYGAYARWAVFGGVISAPGGAFNPTGTVTRAEAAQMLTTAFGHLAATDRVQGVFADTGGTPTTRAIEGIHAAGLTKGCAVEPLRYCPHQPITRAQTATMLARAIQRAEPTVGLIVNEPQAAQGYTLFITRLTDTVYLIDHLGRKVHTWKLEGHQLRHAKLLENGNLMIDQEIPNSGDISILVVDQTGNILQTYSGRTHHDFLVLPNGNVLFIMRGTMTKLEAIARGADSKYLSAEEWNYDYLREVKFTGPNSSETVWEWSPLDHLVQDHDPDKPNYGPIAEYPERIDINYILRRHIQGSWLYGLPYLNAIDYNQALDQIMLTSRIYSELWIIDHNTTTEEAAGEKGDLLYRWGNTRAYGVDNPQDQQLFWPHNAHWIPSELPGGGNVLIFNNGNEYPDRIRHYSSVDEIALPAFENNAYAREPGSDFWSSQSQWTYDTPTFYAESLSSAQRLPNGNTQISAGPITGIVFQVTPNGKTVWKYVNPVPKEGDPAYQGDDLAYRGDDPTRTPFYRAPWYPPDYPGLKDIDLTPKGPIERYR